MARFIALQITFLSLQHSYSNRVYNPFVARERK
jgi:hypothetical protein